MPTRLTVPTLQRTRVASAVQVEKAAIPEAAAQVNSIIPESNRLVVPSLPCRVGKGKQKTKKQKNNNAKQWNDFNRQAARRGKSVTLAAFQHTRLIVQPCFYCGAEKIIGVDRARNNESYTRENSVPCCGPCNMAKRNSSIRAFVQWARAIVKATRARAKKKQQNF